jgi:hypothetical protein
MIMDCLKKNEIKPFDLVFILYYKKFILSGNVATLGQFAKQNSL